MPSADTAPALPVPKTKRGEQTRQKILDAAEIGEARADLLLGRDLGFEDGVDAGQEAIEVRLRGTFYVFFRTKEDVMRELVLRMGRRLRHHLTVATSGIDSRLEVERRGIHAFFEFVRDNPNLYRVVMGMQFVDEATYRRYYEDFAASYRAALEAAVERGELAPGDAEVRAWALMGVCDMVGRRFALWDRSGALDRAAEEAFALIAQGLEPRAAP